jgi:GMP synthase-like glutamine amidotransferase
MEAGSREMTKNRKKRKRLRVIGIQNCEVEGFGCFGEALEARGLEFGIRHVYREPQFPKPETFDAVLVGGTPVSVYAIDGHPFLSDERKWLNAVKSAGKPCLGICFGAQILASILGAPVRRAPRMEIGIFEVELTDAGRKEPLFAGFPPRFPFFQWHGDTFDLPRPASLLVHGRDCVNQVFRSGSTSGLQFHLELGVSDAMRWADAYPEELAVSGKTREELKAELETTEPARRDLSETFIDRFVDWIRQTSYPDRI